MAACQPAGMIPHSKGGPSGPPFSYRHDPKRQLLPKGFPFVRDSRLPAGGPAAACLLPAPILPAILQNKSFRVGKGELEGEGEGLFQKGLPFTLVSISLPFAG